MGTGSDGRRDLTQSGRQPDTALVTNRATVRDVGPAAEGRPLKLRSCSASVSGQVR
jgi:hypothetical protein